MSKQSGTEWPGPGDRRELVDAMERLDVKPGEVVLRKKPGGVGGGGGGSLVDGKGFEGDDTLGMMDIYSRHEVSRQP